MRDRHWILKFMDGVLLFIFVYGLVFKGLGFSTSKIVLFIVFMMVDKKELWARASKNTFIKNSLLIWVIFSIYFFGVTMFAGKYHFGFLQQTFWFFWEGIVGSYIFAFYLLKRYTNKQILYITGIVLTIQSVFVLMSFLSYDFRNVVDSILEVQERNISSVRLKGFSNGGGAGLSYLQALTVFVLGYLYLTGFKGGKRNKLIIVSIILVFISQIFIARTGMIFSGLFIVALIIQNAFNKKSLFPLIIQFVSVVFISVLAYNFYTLIIPADKLAVFNERIVSRAFEFVESYNESGDLRTNSTTVLDNMYFLPKQELSTLFGEGVWDSVEDRKDTYGRMVNSDVGYVRVIFASGLIGALVFYFLYWIYTKGLLKTDTYTYFKLGIFALLIVFVIGELKEPFLIRSSGIIKILCLFLFVSVPIKEKQNSKTRLHSYVDPNVK